MSLCVIYTVVFICSANLALLLIYFSRWHGNTRKIFMVRQKTLKIHWRYYLIHTWLHMAMITKTSSNINCTPLLEVDDMFWSCPIATPNGLQAVDLRGSWSSGSRPSLFYPTIGNIPIQLSEKSPHSMILPPPCLIVGKVFHLVPPDLLLLWLRVSSVCKTSVLLEGVDFGAGDSLLTQTLSDHGNLKLTSLWTERLVFLNILPFHFLW